VQFIKGGWQPGEARALQLFGEALAWHALGEGFTWETQDRERDRQLVQQAWQRSCEYLADGSRKLVVLDEVNVALKLGYLGLDQVLEGLTLRPPLTHVALTGRGAPPGLIERADDAAGSLAYGDQRRLEIARAMCTEPRLLCLDEPAAGLNPRESEELNKLLRAIRSENDVSILLIEHDMSVVMGISDHIVVLDYGQKISDGTPHHVKTDPAVIRAYLGVDEEEEEKDALAAKAVAEAVGDQA
jgi:hypothetical protein